MRMSTTPSSGGGGWTFGLVSPPWQQVQPAEQVQAPSGEVEFGHACADAAAKNIVASMLPTAKRTAESLMVHLSRAGVAGIVPPAKGQRISKSSRDGHLRRAPQSPCPISY